MFRCWKLCVLFVLLNCSCAQNCDEPNIAGIVVGSVFGTLAVVLLVLGIIFFLLWRRRRVFLNTPKKTRKAELTEDVPTPEHEGHVNPAFNDSHADTATAMEQGFGGYVQCNDLDSLPKTKTPVVSPVSKDDRRKTWTSLPRPDIPGIQRQGSLGSLDENILSTMDPDIIGVWLHSQDFIGLGFNISGNMRDGIFVSQVHNRGPAIESGKVNVGDRILSVTISFQNTVFEDALTILSYASPYPVKITLQKQVSAINSQKPNEANENLSHPLYRSQSLDALQRLGKDPLFRPKRTLSEMKPETRKDSSRKNLHDLVNHNFSDLLENKSSSNSSLDVSKAEASTNDHDLQQKSERKINLTVSEVIVHNADDTNMLDFPDSGLQNVKVEINGVHENSENTILPTKVSEQEHIPSTKEKQKDSKYDSTEVMQFASLMDKMLDLDSNKTFEGSTETTNRHVSVEIQADTSVGLNAEQTSPSPTKPRRRKKNSSTTSSTSGDNQKLDVSAAANSGVVLEDCIVAMAAGTVSSAPGDLPETGGEVVEDEIVPETHARDISIGSEKIQFTPHDRAVASQERPPSPPVTRNLVDISEPVETPSVDKDPVEEEVIEASTSKRDSSKPKQITAVSETMPSAEMITNYSSPQVNVTVEEPKAPVRELDDDLLEQIISMNSHAPGTQGIKWINNSDTDLFVDAQNPSRGGIAFEIRDDITTGLPRNLALNKHSISRTMSYDNPLGGDFKGAVRVGSLKETKQSVSNDDVINSNPLDWSGKRLVRSESFSNIPQDDSISDWTDKNLLNVDSNDDLSRASSDDCIVFDMETEHRNKMTRAENVFAARENLANIASDATTPILISTNGQDDGLGTSPELSPLKNNNIEINKTGDKNHDAHQSGGNRFSVTLHANTDDDVDC
ncbi:uncharacterized protein LOC121371248 [Gigantopelta aegis]|uniref:uncharacterized protein LOC121371248 n=1 Tax=Gigantopelta aegis TaxID=1735272 RepID=UPI001B8882BE|nr:uncharacterized protein LOC121371248 [Gigantopelta aegis]